MKQNSPKYYWIFILFLQVYLIIEKVQNDDFYLWNVITLIASILFLYNRIKLNKVLLNPEKIIILMIIINGITSAITNLISKVDIVRIILTILITVLSIIIGNSIRSVTKNVEP